MLQLVSSTTEETATCSSQSTLLCHRTETEILDLSFSTPGTEFPKITQLQDH